MVNMIRNKGGWIKIVEAFVAVLFILGISLIVLNSGNSRINNLSETISEIEFSILQDIQSNSSMRAEILALSSLPISWNDAEFPASIKNKVNSKTPNYLECSAKICALNDTCLLEEEKGGDLFVESIMITANPNSASYNPKQLKLFCWN